MTITDYIEDHLITDDYWSEKIHLFVFELMETAKDENLSEDQMLSCLEGWLIKEFCESSEGLAVFERGDELKGLTNYLKEQIDWDYLAKIFYRGK